MFERVVPRVFWCVAMIALLAVPRHAGAQVPAGPPAAWPQFRGAAACGVDASQVPAPTRWDLATGDNVVWSTPIPGLAHSSPIVWGDRLFVTTAVRREGESAIKVGLYGSVKSTPDEGVHKFQVWCLERNTGQVVWVRTAAEIVPDTKRHPKGSFAASTPATDGHFVAAFFGSEGLFVYDLDGELQWQRDFGVLDAGWYVAPDAQFGYSSSPVIHDGLLFVQCDVQQDPFLCALELATGREVWRIARDEVPTWSTPTVDVANGREQLIVNGYRHIGAYDLRSGEELWRMAGGGDVPVPTPIVAADRVYITNGHGQWNPVYCIDARAEGAIADGFDPAQEPFVIWSQRQQGTYMQTPILSGDWLFYANDAGVVSCLDAVTGERLARQRLGSGGDGFTASPVIADGKLYFTSEEGVVHVLRADATLEPLAENALGEICMATPAAVDGELYFRTRQHVIAVAEGAAQARAARAAALAAAAPKEPGAVEWLASDALPDADALLAAYVAARGGEQALRAIDSIEVDADWEMIGVGMKGRVVSRYRSGERFVSETEIPGMGSMRQGCDGTVVWIIHPAIGKHRLSGAIADELKAQASYFPELSFRSDFAERTTVGRCRFEDQDCFAVDLANGGKRVRLYFAADTSLLYGRDAVVETFGGPSRSIDVYRDYRDFHGILAPAETLSRFPDADIEQVIRIRDIRCDEIDAAVFALPPEIAESSQSDG